MRVQLLKSSRTFPFFQIGGHELSQFLFTRGSPFKVFVLQARQHGTFSSICYNLVNSLNFGPKCLQYIFKIFCFQNIYKKSISGNCHIRKHPQDARGWKRLCQEWSPRGWFQPETWKTWVWRCVLNTRKLKSSLMFAMARGVGELSHKKGSGVQFTCEQDILPTVQKSVS